MQMMRVPLDPRPHSHRALGYRSKAEAAKTEGAGAERHVLPK